METLSLNAYAKLNLTLDILRKRPDGYHDLCMVMQSITLHDTVELIPGGDGGVRCETNLPFLPRDERNLAVKAACVFFAETGTKNPGLFLRIDKRIPACAGMAGGSTDAAAVLRGLRQLFCPALPEAELERIGALVGSDVPYCVRGTTALAEGRGERLTDLAPLPPCWIVVCKPAFSIPTPELFARVQVRQIVYHPDTRGMLAALTAGSLPEVARRMFNVFEEILPAKWRGVSELKRRLLEEGALNAVMSGSGPTVYGLFERRDRAEQACEALRSQRVSVFLEQPIAAP